MTYASGSPDVHVTGRRVVATIIDGILFGVFSNIFASVFGVKRASSGFDLTTLSARGSVWLLVTVVLYYVLLEGLVGRTIGKMITGIRVIDAETGGRPGVVSAVVRTLLRLVDGLFGLPGRFHRCAEFGPSPASWRHGGQDAGRPRPMTAVPVAWSR
jgi:uncharacterized RDD family membrane protein YckC